MCPVRPYVQSGPRDHCKAILESRVTGHTCAPINASLTAAGARSWHEVCFANHDAGSIVWRESERHAPHELIHSHPIRHNAADP